MTADTTSSSAIPETAVACAAVSASLSFACLLNDGFYCPRAIPLLTTALVCAVLVLIWGRGRLSRKGGFRLACLFIGVQAAVTAIVYPGARWGVADLPAIDWLAHAWNDLGWTRGWDILPEAGRVAHAESAAGAWVMRSGVTALAVLGAIATARPKGRWTFPGFVALYFLVGALWLRECPNPHIDVFVVQQEACEALRRGENPYSGSFTDLYGADDPSLPQELHRDGKVLVGYVYPPLTLYPDLAIHLLTGDYRYAQLLAMTLALWLIGTCQSGPYPRLAALGLALSSRSFMALELGFTEPYSILGLALTIVASLRHSRWLPVAFGLLLATKQYTIFLFPLGLLLLPHWNRRDILSFFGGSALTAAIVTLPLALWNWTDFYQSAVAIHLQSLFRKDSLSYLSMLAYQNVPTSQLLQLAGAAFAISAASVLWSLWRSPRSPAAFASAAMTTYLLFFALNKQAFANYYLLVIAMAACAMASLPETIAPDRGRE